MTAVLLVLLAGTVLWLSYRLITLRRGIGFLEDALREDSLPLLQNLSREVSQDRLRSLAGLTLDTVSEADLQRSSAEGRQRIQKVLLDQVEDALFIVDESQEIRYANRASGVLFPGCNTMEGRQLIEVCFERHFAELVDKVLKEGEILGRQIRMTSAARSFRVVSGPIDESYGIGSGAWMIVRDISEELHTEQVRKDFVANASHEFRTPLSIIRGYLEILENEPGREDMVRVMMKHTERLSRIIDDMLLISRIESNDGEELQSMADFDIGGCIAGMIEQLEPLIEKQEAMVKVDLPRKKAERELSGDRFYWDQIFFNLIENALKQNPDPGLKILVRVTHEEDRERFRIEVIDNGVGIPAADISEVFKRFYRVDKSHSQKTRGTGLGLSIVKRAVEAHHGTIEVTSRPGIETVFTVLLPESEGDLPEED